MKLSSKTAWGIAGVIFSLASMANAQGFSFSNTLKVGATGSDVSMLQTWLIQNGYHIPSVESGAAIKGTFGSQTKTAVMKYQKAVGLPSTGFVGPLTLSKLNGTASVSSLVVANSGITATVTSVSATPDATDAAAAAKAAMEAALAGITTPGANGILSVTQGPMSSSVLTVGQQMAPIISIRIQAQDSDLAVPLLTVDLGTDTNIYNKILSKVYVTDGTKVLSSMPLNSSTVVEVEGHNVVGLAGFNFIVPKGTYRDLVVKADLYPSIDSRYTSESPWYISIDPLSVGAFDGAGVNLYAPPTDPIVQAITINPSLVDTAQASLSTSGNTPQSNAFSVSDTANGNYLGLPVLSFNLYAQNDALHLHKIVANIANTGGGTVSAAYLFQGSTQVASASVSGGVATFDNITDGTNGATIPAGQSLTYTIKADVTGVTNTPAKITASLASGSQIVYNSTDSTVTISGSPQGNQQTVNGVGPSYSLASSPRITVSGSNQVGSSLSTSTIVASFPLVMSSVGSDTYFGTVASSSPAFLFYVLDSAGTVVYSGYGQGTNIGVISNSGNLSGTKVILPTLPTQVTPAGIPSNSFVISNQQSISLGTVQFQFDGKSASGQVLTGGPYKVNLARIRYVIPAGYATSSFMDSLAAWTTNGQNP